jgi:hypothetical protein
MPSVIHSIILIIIIIIIRNNTHTQITEKIILHTISISSVTCGNDSCKCNADTDIQVTVMYNA